MGVWTKPPVKTEPKPEVPVSSPAPVSPTGKQAEPPAAKPPPKPPSPPAAKAAPVSSAGKQPPAVKQAAPPPPLTGTDPISQALARSIAFVPGRTPDRPSAGPKGSADDFVLKGSSVAAPKRAAAIREEQQRVALRQRDLDEDRVKARTTAAAETSATPFRVLAPSGISPEPFDPLIKAMTAVASVEAAAAPLEQKSEFLGAAQRILTEQAHLDLLEAQDKLGIVTAPALLARKRTELAAKYPQAIGLNVPLLIPRTDGEGAHPTIKAFVAANETERIEMRRQLQELVGQRQAAFAGAGDADRPQAAFEFLQVALLRDAIEDESRRQRGVK